MNLIFFLVNFIIIRLVTDANAPSPISSKKYHSKRLLVKLYCNTVTIDVKNVVMPLVALITNGAIPKCNNIGLFIDAPPIPSILIIIPLNVAMPIYLRIVMTSFHCTSPFMKLNCCFLLSS